MAYSVSWDETSPNGATTAANTIDTEIQNLKTSVRERLEDLLPDWSNDGVDPKVAAAAFTPVSASALASRPSAVRSGHGFFATDKWVNHFADGTTWRNPGGSAVEYDADLGAGSRVTAERTYVWPLYVRLQGTTDGNGIIEFDITEVASYPTMNIVGVVGTIDGAGGAALGLILEAFAVGTTTIQFQVKWSDTGVPAVAASRAVEISAVVFLSS